MPHNCPQDPSADEVHRYIDVYIYTYTQIRRIYTHSHIPHMSGTLHLWDSSKSRQRAAVEVCPLESWPLRWAMPCTTP